MLDRIATWTDDLLEALWDCVCGVAKSLYWLLTGYER